jgi:arylsulfatase A-like enzyme
MAKTAYPQRRRFLRTIGGTFAAAMVSGRSHGAPAQEARPDILFCLADDWGWPHAGAYGTTGVQTPTFDRIAAEGVLFNHAFCAAPSCTPSRAAMLTGQAPHRLAEGGNLHGFLPQRFPVYTDILERAGYRVGFTRKGWGPGNFAAGGRMRNPAGTTFDSFEKFLGSVKKGEPFAFWFGSQDPHRPYEAGSGLKSGLKPEAVVVPPYLPDLPEVRHDILDYYFEVQRFDTEVGNLLRLLEQTGRAQNTLVVVTGDNGWPFPRSKANLYDAGTRLPLAVRWPARIRGGRVLNDFIGLADLAPTFLHAAGVKPVPEMSGRSFAGILTGEEKGSPRDVAFVERERHANVRKGDLGYPSRAIRTREFLYIRNLRPDRWPAGDPELYFSVGPYGDCDGSPTKEAILARGATQPHFALGFEKRPAEELYDLTKDPHQINNVAGRAEYVEAQASMRSALERWQKTTADPRATTDDDRWDHYPYFGARA